MNNFYTYELCSSEFPNLPFYIGKGKDRRMYKHEQNAKNYKCNNKHLQRKILKIKRNGYQIIYKKIAENVSEQDAFAIEKDIIAFNRNLGFKLCNHTDGGGNGSPDKITRYKMSKSAKGHIKSKIHCKHLSESLKKYIKTDEHRRHISESHIGIIPWNKNKPGSQISWNKGKKMPKGPNTKEHNEKISKANKGQIPWNKGKHKDSNGSYYCYSLIFICEIHLFFLNNLGVLNAKNPYKSSQTN